MSKPRKSNYRLSGERLLKHLDAVLHPDTGYPDKPSWGYAFSYLAALLTKDGESSPLAKKALHHLALQDSTDLNYSWEFVVYALQTARYRSPNLIPAHMDGYREKGTRMFNWFLLRRLNKKLCNTYNTIDHLKLWLASKIYQESSGLILDEFKTRSLQYHAFCLFAIAELLETDPGNTWLKRWFTEGIRFSLSQTLEDGTALYIGRGQEQIFGYGALIYSIEYCHSKVKTLNEDCINQISARLLSFQREDGSYPLVLRHRDPEPKTANFADDKPAGWYGYNTLYDYQPFLAYCLLKASNLR